MIMLGVSNENSNFGCHMLFSKIIRTRMCVTAKDDVEIVIGTLSTYA